MINCYNAGKLYEADFENLANQLKQCFLDKKGPGELPAKRTNKTIKGIITPHSGYFLAGPCQAWAYKAIAESKFPKRFLIISPDHKGLHSSPVTCYEDWETPLGILRTDKDYIEKLLDSKLINKTPTIQEHSIELQLPFLQFANKDKMKDILIVPLIIPNNTTNFQEIAEMIAEIDDDICVIIASEFSHYGPKFNYTPFGCRMKERMKQLDNGAIEAIKTLEHKNLINYVQKTKAIIPGSKAIALGMEILKELFSKKVQLLQYYPSSEIIEDENGIGYASLSLE